MSYQETYKTITEGLLKRSLTTDDGFSNDDVQAGVAAVGGHLPLALRDYYEVVGLAGFNQAHNRLVGPTELEIKDGSECVAVIHENQTVCSWGVKTADLGEDDPPAFCIPTGEDEVHSEDCTLSEFLVINLYLQCCWGGLEYHGINKRAKKFMPQIRKSWTQVVDHSGLIVWENDGLLVSDMEESFVLGAASTEEGFKVLVKDYGFKPDKR